MILNGKESKDVQKHYLLVDGLVYFISNFDDDPRLRLNMSVLSHDRSRGRGWDPIKPV